MKKKLAPSLLSQGRLSLLKILEEQYTQLTLPALMLIPNTPTHRHFERTKASLHYQYGIPGKPGLINEKALTQALKEEFRHLSPMFRKHCLYLLVTSSLPKGYPSLHQMFEQNKADLSFTDRLLINALFIDFVDSTSFTELSKLADMTEENAKKEGSSLTEIAETLCSFSIDGLLGKLVISPELNDALKPHLQSEDFKTLHVTDRLYFYFSLNQPLDSYSSRCARDFDFDSKGSALLKLSAPNLVKAVSLFKTDIKTRTKALAKKLEGKTLQEREDILKSSDRLEELDPLLLCSELKLNTRNLVVRRDVEGSKTRLKVAVDLAFQLFQHGIDTSATLCAFYSQPFISIRTYQDPQFQSPLGIGFGTYSNPLLNPMTDLSTISVRTYSCFDYRLGEVIPALLRKAGIDLSGLSPEQLSNPTDLVQHLQKSDGKPARITHKTGEFLLYKTCLSKVKADSLLLVLSVIRSLIQHGLTIALNSAEASTLSSPSLMGIPQAGIQIQCPFNFPNLITNLFISVRRSFVTEKEEAAISHSVQEITEEIVRKLSGRIEPPNIQQCVTVARMVCEQEDKAQLEEAARKARTPIEQVKRTLDASENFQQMETLMRTLDLSLHNQEELLRLFDLEIDPSPESEVMLRWISDIETSFQYQGSIHHDPSLKTEEGDRQSEMMYRKIDTALALCSSNKIPRVESFLLLFLRHRFILVPSRIVNGVIVPPVRSQCNHRVFSLTKMILSRAGITLNGIAWTDIATTDESTTLAKEILSKLLEPLPQTKKIKQIPLSPISTVRKDQLIPVLHVITILMLRTHTATKKHNRIWERQIDSTISNIQASLLRHGASQEEIESINAAINRANTEYRTLHGLSLFNQSLPYYARIAERFKTWMPEPKQKPSVGTTAQIAITPAIKAAKISFIQGLTIHNFSTAQKQETQKRMKELGVTNTDIESVVSALAVSHPSQLGSLLKDFLEPDVYKKLRSQRDANRRKAKKRRKKEAQEKQHEKQQLQTTETLKKITAVLSGSGRSEENLKALEELLSQAPDLRSEYADQVANYKRELEASRETKRQEEALFKAKTQINQLLSAEPTIGAIREITDLLDKHPSLAPDFQQSLDAYTQIIQTAVDQKIVSYGKNTASKGSLSPSDWVLRLRQLEAEGLTDTDSHVWRLFPKIPAECQKAYIQDKEYGANFDNSRFITCCGFADPELIKAFRAHPNSSLFSYADGLRHNLLENRQFRAANTKVFAGFGFSVQKETITQLLQEKPLPARLLLNLPLPLSSCRSITNDNTLPKRFRQNVWAKEVDFLTKSSPSIADYLTLIHKGITYGYPVRILREGLIQKQQEVLIQQEETLKTLRAQLTTATAAAETFNSTEIQAVITRADTLTVTDHSAQTTATHSVAVGTEVLDSGTQTNYHDQTLSQLLPKISEADTKEALIQELSSYISVLTPLLDSIVDGKFKKSVGFIYTIVHNTIHRASALNMHRARDFVNHLHFLPMVLSEDPVQDPKFTALDPHIREIVSARLLGADRRFQVSSFISAAINLGEHL